MYIEPRRCALPGARVGNTPKFAKRMRDISSWQEENISSLSARAKKKYYKRKFLEIQEVFIILIYVINFIWIHVYVFNDLFL